MRFMKATLFLSLATCVGFSAHAKNVVNFQFTNYSTSAFTVTKETTGEYAPRCWYMKQYNDLPTSFDLNAAPKNGHTTSPYYYTSFIDDIRKLCDKSSKTLYLTFTQKNTKEKATYRFHVDYAFFGHGDLHIEGVSTNSNFSVLTNGPTLTVDKNDNYSVTVSFSDLSASKTPPGAKKPVLPRKP